MNYWILFGSCGGMFLLGFWLGAEFVLASFRASKKLAQADSAAPDQPQEAVPECSCYLDADGGPYGLPHVVSCRNCDAYFNEHGAWPSWSQY